MSKVKLTFTDGTIEIIDKKEMTDITLEEMGKRWNKTIMFVEFIEGGTK